MIENPVNRVRNDWGPGGSGMSRIKSRHERRDTSPAGGWNRAQFEASLNRLRSLGLSPRAVEHFRRLARETGRLPHELVLEIVEEAASHPSEAVRFALYSHAGRTGGI